MPYCFNCGAETEAGAAYCSSCGARLEDEAPPPRPPARTGFPWAILGAIIVLVVIVAGGVVLFGVLAGDGDEEERLPGGEEEERAEAISSPTVPPTPEAVTAAPEATPSVEPSPVPEESPRTEPTTMPPPAGHATPEEAIAAFLQERGLAYIGDCETASLETDVGFYCSILWEDQFDTRIYLAGLTFSEADTWLLVSRLGARDDWTVVDFAPVGPLEEEFVPPWP